MKYRGTVWDVSVLCGVVLGLTGPAAGPGEAAAPGYPLQPVTFERVTLDDQFWLPRLATQRKVLVPHAFRQTEEALSDLRAAADLLAGRELKNPPPPHRYRTSDLFKVMEGAAYLLAIERDPQLERHMDDIISTIAAAQEPDGYLNATRTLYPHEAIDMMGDGKYAYIDHGHELYIVGHMYEAAVAYFRATGKRSLLDVAERNARHVYKVFFEGDPNYNNGEPKNQAPGHEEIELALVRLADVTGNLTYLELAQRFLDIRGVTYVPRGEGVFAATYAQQHEPVTTQSAPVGHAVRAMYLYSGMADVGAMTASDRYDAALARIWTNIVDTRMHITGGLGAVPGIEGFGPEYFLPNEDAFNETCAAVGNVFFNWRMFLRHHDAKFLDVAEIALYNNVLAGVNLAGDRFFYVNPLAADGSRPFNHGRPRRAPWFGTACCPTNIARLIPQVPGMIFAEDDEGLTVCLYAGSRTKLELGGVPTEVEIDTQYPFNGEVQLMLSPQSPARFAVRLRIPTWTTDQLVPGKLYQYASDDNGSTSTAAQAPKLLVNDEPVELSVNRGLATIERLWSRGDRVRLELPMPVRVSTCRDEVEANRGRIAVSRGPLVYCAESVDNPPHAFDYMLRREDVSRSGEVTEFSIDRHDTRAISIAASRLTGDDQWESARLLLVPYYAWNNRGTGSMVVWLPDNEQTCRAGRK